MALVSRGGFVTITVLFVNTLIYAAAPSAPTSPKPAPKSNGASKSNLFLTWSHDSSVASYSVEFGTTNPPPVVASGLTDASFGRTNLTACTPYFWRVTAHNADGDTPGPLWSFKTTGCSAKDDPKDDPPDDCAEELNDCHEKFQLVGGVEESGFSSLGTNTNAFLQAFTETATRGAAAWGRIRLLGAPQEANNGIISTFTDPTGTLQKQDFSKVGQAIDFAAGIKINPHWGILKRSGPYSINPIIGAGFTTPLSSQDVVLRYLSPDFGTFECQALQSQTRFASDFARLGVKPGSTTCLVGPDGKTAITQIAFSNQDRSNFLGKWGVGIRTTTRFNNPDDEDHDPQRGTVDAVVGQDAIVTGGVMSGWVLKLDGVHPMPFGGTGSKSYLYLFGSAEIRISHNKNLDPLILKTVDPTVASPAIPSPEVVVLPLRQANRDFYRIGIGLDLKQIFTKLQTPK